MVFFFCKYFLISYLSYHPLEKAEFLEVFFYNIVELYTQTKLYTFMLYDDGFIASI